MMMMMESEVFPYFVPRFGKSSVTVMAALAGVMIAWSGAVAAELACGAPENGQERLSLRLPENVRPMSAVELHELYRDKSWKWCDGAAYLQDEGRIFKGWSGSGNRASWALGRWTVADSGRMCLEADWHVQTGASSDRTCFEHMTDGQTIYQRKEPTGDWYVFKHSEPQESDEFAKLVPEDLVSQKLDALRK
ncbi:DUF995 domain-containing protein [Mesorhizobium sp. CCNWLW179-1]|uniref:DUF995 domain-containing protein n=1 Tax=unclassified Mesorhizobium TaxID=325217 RepID=UPI0030142DB2